ncbi:MAG: RtcB family protein [Candidatus Tectomicrobia bacterium]|uniref:tRNA-splicing ligase RtcB n=1 Tax=Tectimicrobiota bacterium TaxID=2528274 RepID=A0A932CQU3_UNCTE|nr:RtcB family protein [Candidatus Tectomicrobia bacterium]
MSQKLEIKLQKVDRYRWRIPQAGTMRVEGLIYADERMIEGLQREESLQQVINVAHLPGIVGQSLAMPDIHWGYGFPIGGVAATDVEQGGVVSPGGVGFDINCGVRLLSSSLSRPEIQDRLQPLIDLLFAHIPSGVGSHRKDLRLSLQDEAKVLQQGAQWAVRQGMGTERDLEYTEDGGCLSDTDPEEVSSRALERGKSQLGTLGSGNHFVEVGYVSEVYEEETARAWGLERDQITVIIHTGSRGLGYQICEDAIETMLEASRRYGIALPDRQLCCAPVSSPEGQGYLRAMACAANYAFANRQMITHGVRQTFEQVFRRGPRHLQLELVYDVCHNIAKLETHRLGDREGTFCVHRKGATRALPPGHPALPLAYRPTGQPVLVPGDMGRCSYVLVGTETAARETFASTCHGAGRLMSRQQAKKATRGRSIARELEDRGILVRAASRETLVEEAPEAYKDVSQVVEVSHRAGISRKVAQLRPLVVMKG